MKDEDLSGRWWGMYVYGEAYGFEAGKKCPFTIDMKVEDGFVSGICTDDIVKETFDRPATIEGKFENDHIWFVKRYPATITDSFGNVCDAPGEYSFEIFYSGHLSKRWFSKEIYFEGEWEITHSYLDENNVAIHNYWNGWWELKKE